MNLDDINLPDPRAVGAPDVGAIADDLVELAVAAADTVAGHVPGIVDRRASNRRRQMLSVVAVVALVVIVAVVIRRRRDDSPTER